MSVSNDEFMNIAHRGYSGRYPENTLLAFEKAIELGCRWLECDVRLTSDGVPVVIHDATVDRTTNGTGVVSDLAWSHIRALDAGSWKEATFVGERVPSLDELLDTVHGRAQIVVELKCDTERVDEILDVVERRNAISWTAASAFEWETIVRVRQIAPNWRTTYLTRLHDVSVSDAIERCVEAGVDTFGPVANRTDGEVVKAAHAAGLLVRCWGLGDDRGPEMRRLVGIGVDGMTTNWPDELAAVIDERKTRNRTIE